MSIRQQFNVQNKRKNIKKKKENNDKLDNLAKLDENERSKIYDEMKDGNIKMNDPIEKAILDANKLWDDIKKRIKDNEEFFKLDDSKKVEIYQNSEFKHFYNTYPIVCRYMICMGQFSNKAFRRFLVKSSNVAKQPIKREKGYNEDQWVQRQADYIRYLWESFQPTRFSKKESDAIWRNAYETLKKEFSNFRKMHEDVSNKLKEEKKLNKKELIKEMIERLSDQDNNESSNVLLEKLKQLKNNS